MPQTGGKDLVKQLRELGYRVTGPRKTIVEAVAGWRHQFTASDVCQEVARVAPSVGRATVFRTLDLLSSVGLISRVHEGDGCHGYVICSECPVGHHHHLVCSRCGLVVRVSECDLDEQSRRLAERTHFRIDGHRLEFYGVCDACMKVES